MSVIELIKSKIAISDIVRKDIILSKKGNEYVGKCPFHLEKTASFFVSDIRKSFHCFGCGISGDVFKYVMQKKNITFKQALLELADIAHVKLDYTANNNTNLYKILSFAWNFFRSKINFPIAQKYISYRNLNNNNVGYAPPHYDLYNDLAKLFPISDIRNSGLFTLNNVPRFRNRLIFPIFNINDTLVAFGGRLLSNTEVGPKYLNSPDSEIFHKHLVLFMLNHAVKYINKNNPPIVVEGYIDVLTLHKYGFNTAVGTMGTALSQQHLELLWKFSNCPIICLDGDNAGQSAMQKVAILCLKYLQPGKSIKFCLLPANTDPDDFLNFHGASAFSKLLQRSLNLIDFLWQNFISKREAEENQIPENIAKLEQDLFDLINTIQDIRIRNLYISNIKKRIYNSRKVTYKINSETKSLNQQLLLYILIQKPRLINFIIEPLTNLDFKSNNLNLVRDFILQKANRNLVNMDIATGINRIECNEILNKSHETKNTSIDKEKEDDNLKRELTTENTQVNNFHTIEDTNQLLNEDENQVANNSNIVSNNLLQCNNAKDIATIEGKTKSKLDYFHTGLHFDDNIDNNAHNDCSSQIDMEDYSEIVKDNCDLPNMESIINTICANCEKNFNFKQKSDEELIREWYDLFNRVFSISQEKCDLHCASQECRQNVSTNTWTRLKNLKIYLLKKGKN